MRTLSASILNRRSICLALVVTLAFDSCEEDLMKSEKQDSFSEIEFQSIPEVNTHFELTPF
ncbi:MAG TPA: hypothetical protein VK589_06300 [Chryseolinea sp.]|nr:hypothetical protein [Chryseolinea sp.]